MPRPTRRRAFLEPAAGLMVLSRMLRIPFAGSLLDHLDEIADLVDHPARLRRVDDFDRVARPLEAQTAHRRTMIFARACDAFGELDLDFLALRHVTHRGSHRPFYRASPRCRPAR